MLLWSEKFATEKRPQALLAQLSHHPVQREGLAHAGAARQKDGLPSQRRVEGSLLLGVERRLLALWRRRLGKERLDGRVPARLVVVRHSASAAIAASSSSSHPASSSPSSVQARNHVEHPHAVLLRLLRPDPGDAAQGAERPRPLLRDALEHLVREDEVWLLLLLSADLGPQRGERVVGQYLDI